MRNYGKAQGFTLIELLVTMLLGSLLLAMALSVALVNRSVLGKEQVRLQLAQNLRSALDITGLDLRVAGENLSHSFPAIEITNGASGAPDTLTLRRNLLDEVLPVCVSIVAGTGTTQVVFANSPTQAGCVYAGHTHNYNSWRSYRLAEGGTVDAYIFDSVSKHGEFFRYNGEIDTGSEYSITRTSGTWTYNYPAGSSSVYILEEWKYYFEAGLFKLQENRDNARIYNVIFGVTDFQARAHLQDGSSLDDFGPTQQWTQLAQVQVDLTGSDAYARNTMTRTVSARFFPRNVLSN
jgi:prepilin-type N-terminal cleavage/methylation domain-containing protein